jgi:CRISPR-associated protein Cmr6
MRLPLYKGASLTITTETNRSLLFDKFYRWKELGALLKEQDKDKNLETLTGSCGNRKQIEKQAERMCDLLENLGGRYEVFRNTWHVAVGMGVDHPLENGLVWHPTLGTPYIPGSSVKGMVRAWCEQWEGWDVEKIEKVFGKATENETDAASGEYIFFDALPVAEVHLTSDVMTPHMGKWYEKGGDAKHDDENKPGDWHSPVPVFFLVVKEIKPLFAIAPRPGTDGKYLDTLMKALKNALQSIGIGAKTAAGYGRFEVAVGDTFHKRGQDFAQRERKEQERRIKKGFEKIVGEARTRFESIVEHDERSKESGDDLEKHMHILQEAETAVREFSEYLSRIEKEYFGQASLSEFAMRAKEELQELGKKAKETLQKIAKRHEHAQRNAQKRQESPTVSFDDLLHTEKAKQLKNALQKFQETGKTLSPAKKRD